MWTRRSRAILISGVLLVVGAILVLALRWKVEQPPTPGDSARSRQTGVTDKLEARSSTGRILVRAVGAAVPRTVTCVLNGETFAIEPAPLEEGHFALAVPGAGEGDAFSLSAEGFFSADGRFDEHLAAETELLAQAVLVVSGPRREEGGFILGLTPSAGGETQRRKAIPYRFQPLRAGAFELGVFRAASGRLLSRFPIELRWGETRNLHLGALPPIRTIRGSVWAGAGTPLPGATIEVWLLNPVNDGKYRTTGTTTTQGGAFSLSPLAGRYRIIARKSGFQPSAREVDVSRSDVAAVRLILDRAIRLSGIVQNESREPIADASVFLHRISEGKGSSAEFTRSGANGRFEFAEIGPGSRVSLRVFKDGFRNEAVVLGGVRQIRG